MSKKNNKMFKSTESGNIKTISQEIVKHCLSKRIHVTEECAEFVIKLLLSDPEGDFTLDVPVDEDDVKNLVKLCVSKLADKESPSVMTIKMQAYFYTNYSCRDEIISKSHAAIQVQTSPLIKEIIETQTANSKEDLERLYRKLVIATILGSGLGYPTNTGVLKEATAALESIFPLAELSHFINFSHMDRDRQVKELTQVVTGIRLFNRDCHRGGEGIDDLPKILQKMVAVAHTNLEASLKKLMNSVNILTAAVDAGWRSLVLPSSQPAADWTWTHVDLFRDMLLLARQQEVFLRKLLADVESSQSSIDNLIIRLQKTLLRIHDSVRFRTAIPTFEVYPHFIKLSEIWTGLQDEMVALTSIDGIMWNLLSYTELLDNVDTDMLEAMIGDNPVLSDEARLQSSMGTFIESAKMTSELIHPAAFPDFDHITLQYQGFCPWVLAKGRGALVPANQNIGVARWQGKYYAFSSPEAAYEFDKDPKYYTTTIATLAHFVPELIDFLQSDAQTSPSKAHQELKVKSSKITKHDYGMQTELHPVPSHIDPDYSWNVWELRRQAAHLAKICNSRTHSTQTHVSCSRKSIGCQAVPPKEASTQTKRDGSVQTPQPRNYIFGLRGRRENIQHVISLTPTVHD